MALSWLMGGPEFQAWALSSAPASWWLMGTGWLVMLAPGWSRRKGSVRKISAWAS